MSRALRRFKPLGSTSGEHGFFRLPFTNTMISPFRGGHPGPDPTPQHTRVRERGSRIATRTKLD